MSLLNLDLDNVKPPEILPDGTEAIVEIANTRESDDDATYPWIMVWFTVPESLETPDFSHLLSLPSSNDTDKQAYAKKQKLVEFMQIFNIDSLDLEEWVGAQSTAILTVEEYQGAEQNKIKSFVTAG